MTDIPTVLPTTVQPSTVLTTPPPLRGDRAPYNCIPLPPQLGVVSRLTIHPALQYSSASSICYDLSQKPPLRQLGVERYLLCEPATKPALPSFSLLIPNFPWPIVVHGSSVEDDKRVSTVSDVLKAIYHALQLPVENDGQDGILSTQMSSEHGSGHLSRVVRRLEYLGTRLMFLGLSPSREHVEAFVVHVE